MLCEYSQTRVMSFPLVKLEVKPQSGFTYGMEAAAHNRR